MSDCNQIRPKQLARASFMLTHEGALHILAASVRKAEAMNVPQCIAIVDSGCNLLAFVRMDGARLLSIKSATHKAMTAASTGLPTGQLPQDKAPLLAAATNGAMTNLPGGLPLVANGHVVGGIGVGSGSSDQDVEVASAGVASLNKGLDR